MRRPRSKFASALFCVALLTAIFAGVVLAQRAFAELLEDTFRVPNDHPAIRYSDTPPADPVAALEKKLESREANLDYIPNGWGYLPSLLKQLGIDVDSQVLVFSKGSIQAEHINPSTPRAIYFNDQVAVGFVQNGQDLELTGLDPKQGIYFYTLENARTDKPRLTRREDCLRCHDGPVSLGVPGMLVSSLKPSTAGPGAEHGSSYATDDRVSISLRWGGWYVTGSTGDQTHYGNNTNLVDPLHPGGPMELGTQNVTNLATFFDVSKYPARTSDVVSLMTLEHQVRMTNLLTRIGWDTRIALHDNMHDGKLDEDAGKKLDDEIEQMVSYMLFADESLLKSPVAGNSDFAKDFAARGPRDSQGRSLRDFDLRTRLFKYPLSYMIYSDAFDGLPDLARERVYRRLYDILSGKDQSEDYSHLSAQDRAAVLEIVRDTKGNLPAYWQAKTR